jgi:hypothetical protein
MKLFLGTHASGCRGVQRVGYESLTGTITGKLANCNNKGADLLCVAQSDGLGSDLESEECDELEKIEPAASDSPMEGLQHRFPHLFSPSPEEAREQSLRSQAFYPRDALLFGVRVRTAAMLQDSYPTPLN